MKLFWRYM